jgi:adenylate kinase family enzyme
VKRVSVVGTSGSGKTTFARDLAARMGVPHVELDALYHRPNWTHVDDDELARQVGEAVAGEGWVVDGNYSRVRHIVWEAADTIVWLDYPKWLVMSRMMRRTLGRVATQRKLWHGNRERWRNLIDPNPEENIILWAWTTHGRYRCRYQEAFASPEWTYKNLVRLSSPAEARRFLSEAEVGM